MTDETNQETESTQTPDDERFEVKWRKKESSTPTSPVPEEEAAEPADETGLRRQLGEEKERVRTLQDRWQRAAADLANLRRRTEQERGEMEQFATMVLVSELLPVLDNFERALQTIPGNLEMLTWIQGIMLIERHLRALLERQGLAPIETEGQQFNPHFHEAVSERETAEATPGVILQEYQRGYTMHGRILRPSLVEVAAAPRSDTEAEPEAVTTDTAQTETIAVEAETENIGP